MRDNSKVVFADLSDAATAQLLPGSATTLTTSAEHALLTGGGSCGDGGPEGEGSTMAFESFGESAAAQASATETVNQARANHREVVLELVKPESTEEQQRKRRSFNGGGAQSADGGAEMDVLRRVVQDLSLSSRYVAKGHMSLNWLRSVFATRARGKCQGFVTWLLDGSLEQNAGDLSNSGSSGGGGGGGGRSSKYENSNFRRFDKDKSGTIELPELEAAIEAYGAELTTTEKKLPPKRPTPLTVGVAAVDYRKLRGKTPPVGLLGSLYAGLSASSR